MRSLNVLLAAVLSLTGCLEDRRIEDLTEDVVETTADSPCTTLDRYNLRIQLEGYPTDAIIHARWGQEQRCPQISGRPDEYICAAVPCDSKLVVNANNQTITYPGRIDCCGQQDQRTTLKRP